MGPGETFISLIIGVTVIGYIFFTARHRERMSMIDKGVGMSFFDSAPKTYPNFTLKLGMLFVGVAIGIFLGDILSTYTRMQKGVAFVSMIFLFGGISLIINFLIERNMKEK